MKLSDIEPGKCYRLRFEDGDSVVVVCTGRVGDRWLLDSPDLESPLTAYDGDIEAGDVLRPVGPDVV